MSGPVMIMAGGTGGHVFPGLTVAEVLRERGRRVVWLGTRRGLEARVVPQHGIDIEWISVAGLRGKGLTGTLTAPFRAAFAVGQALAVLRRRKPSAVLGMGGFVSGPGGLAAWLTRRPLVIHEQNAIAGTTNRWLARFATRVFEAFPGSFPRRVSPLHVGNPVRRSIAALPPASERIAELTARKNVSDTIFFAGEPSSSASASEKMVSDTFFRPRRARLLVIGGSQGARVLNVTVPAALARLPDDVRPDVRHQAGRFADEARAAYRDAGVSADVREFIDDMADAYGWADVVVARAGALTIAELAAAGLPAVLVPYPYAIDDHQTRNAEWFTGAGAGVVIPERELDAERLAAELGALLAAPDRLAAMADAARGLARVDAAERIADTCIALAEGRR
ncbi:MAG TPA: undecaprenyldiphospho-muramoylpentapeptide beta-N-acetylglucosaminyltransferase [Gammaproteobacteria bacterium]